jgi:hypothetical protein
MSTGSKALETGAGRDMCPNCTASRAFLRRRAYVNHERWRMESLSLHTSTMLLTSVIQDRGT